MKVKRINHLGVAPKDHAAATHFFGEILGLAHEGSETVEQQKVRVEFLRTENSRIEILAATADDSPIAKFVATRGAGIQHVAFEVDDIDAWVGRLKDAGVRLIDETPKAGAHQTRIVFVHPQSTGGVLVELVEELKK